MIRLLTRNLLLLVVSVAWITWVVSAMVLERQQERPQGAAVWVTER